MMTENNNPVVTTWFQQQQTPAVSAEIMAVAESFDQTEGINRKRHASDCSGNHIHLLNAGKNTLSRRHAAAWSIII